MKTKTSKSGRWVLLRSLLTKALTLGILASVRPAAAQQGTFEDLDFEQALIVITDSGQPFTLVSRSAALPPWRAYVGTNSLINVVYNNLSLGTPIVSIHDSFSPVLHPLDGNYSVALQHSSGGTPASASIAQFGTLPDDALSLTFDAVGYQGLQVTFAGNLLPLVPLTTTANYDEVGADISAFAGQTGELRFTSISGGAALDDIQFSPVSVPEPGAIALFGIGALGLGLSLRRKIRTVTCQP